MDSIVNGLKEGLKGEFATKDKAYLKERLHLAAVMFFPLAISCFGAFVINRYLGYYVSCLMSEMILHMVISAFYNTEFNFHGIWKVSCYRLFITLLMVISRVLMVVFTIPLLIVVSIIIWVKNIIYKVFKVRYILDYFVELLVTIVFIALLFLIIFQISVNVGVTIKELFFKQKEWFTEQTVIYISVFFTLYVCNKAFLKSYLWIIKKLNKGVEINHEIITENIILKNYVILILTFIAKALTLTGEAKVLTDALFYSMTVFSAIQRTQTIQQKSKE